MLVSTCAKRNKRNESFTISRVQVELSNQKRWVKLKTLKPIEKKMKWPHGRVPKSKQIDLGLQDIGMP